VTVHVISVGLSVLHALTSPDAFDEESQKPKFIMERAVVNAIRQAKPAKLLASAGIGDRNNDEASDWLTAAFDGGGSPERDKLAAVAKSIRPAQWAGNMSAEIETFSRVGGFPLHSTDIAVLVCSDTPAGLLAGVWNALAITGGDLKRVRYVPDAANPDGRLDNLHDHVVIARVTGLDARNTQGFQQAMSNLGKLARHLFKSGGLERDEEFRFYLSGGYKAAIPYLIGMAEAVRSIDRTCLEEMHKPDLALDKGRRWSVKAFMLHEAAPAGSPIELPLRRLVARVVREELTEWRNGKRDGIPGRGLLEGYAYEVGPGRPEEAPCTITPFGVGLRALFGLSHEGVGG
jgi:hypothetical protein